LLYLLEQGETSVCILMSKKSQSVRQAEKDASSKVKLMQALLAASNRLAI